MTITAMLSVSMTASAAEVSIAMNTDVPIVITEPGQIVSLYFTPKTSGIYKIYSTGNTDAECSLYSSDGKLLKSHGESTIAFEINYYLKSGSKYRIDTKSHYNNKYNISYTLRIENGSCEHSYKSTVKTKATTSKNGSIAKICSNCGYENESTVIYYAKTVSLSKTSYTYDGKEKKPTVTIKDSKGNKISTNYYTVSYASGRKNVGSYKVTIKFKGHYSGTVTKTYKIVPKGTSISSITAKSKGFVVKFKQQTTQTTGYQVQYSTNKNFDSAQSITSSKNNVSKCTFTGMKSKKKYYVRIRTYKTVNKTKYYSSWSEVKSVTTK
jgi:hypothetical protein